MRRAGTRTDVNVCARSIAARRWPGLHERRAGRAMLWETPSTPPMQDLSVNPLSSAGGFQPTAVGSDSWRVSDDDPATSGLISDQAGPMAFMRGLWRHAVRSIRRCAACRRSRRRGLKASLYVMMNMDVTGQPWRGLVTYASDVSGRPQPSARLSFLGSAATSQFTQDATNLTVHYSGNVLDFTYRRFVCITPISRSSRRRLGLRHWLRIARAGGD